MSGLVAEVAPLASALSLGAGGFALLSTRARTSGMLLLTTTAALVVAVIAGSSGHPAAALYVAAGLLLPSAAALLAYPTPDFGHPVDFCLWVVAVAGGVLVVAIVALGGGAAGSIGSIVAMAAAGRGWRILESGDEEDRTAMLWVALAALVALVGTVPVFLVEPNEAWELSFTVLPPIAFGPAMAIGVRRPDLVDVRSLVVSVVVLIVVAISYLSAFLAVDAVLDLLGEPRIAPVGYASIGLVLAAGFHPLRVVLRGLIEELLFGDRPDPLVAATAVADRIGDDPLLTLRAVREALVLPHASIIVAGEEVAASGVATTDAVRIPLRVGDDVIGQMTVGLRPGQLHLSAEDQQVLRIVGALLTQTLRARTLAGEVSESRSAAISAIEDERRRLRRDLHDGLGPTLSGIAHTASAARNVIPVDPVAADELLARLRTDAADAVGEIRRLVYDMRPPALDELGLEAALRQQLETLRTADGRAMQVVVRAGELPPLPASVEVAAYRIATEAVTNSARHSGSDRAWVELDHVDGHLVLGISDAGTDPAPWMPGVGVAPMRERTSEVGGTIEIVGGPSGISVSARLPLP